MGTFITDFVKALPGALATAVVTVLLAGGVLFIFQEKIKASVARSLFEHQTKFSRAFPKTLEILEIYIQKVNKASELVSDFVCLFEPASSDTDDTEKLHLQEEVSKIQIEFSQTSLDAAQYIRANRLFLSDEILAQVEQLYQKEHTLSVIFTACMQNPDEPLRKVFPLAIIWLHREFPQGFSLDTRSGLFISRLQGYYDNLVIRLERLYKSVAEIKDNT
jgi:hypothetical protein